MQNHRDTAGQRVPESHECRGQAATAQVALGQNIHVNASAETIQTNIIKPYRLC